MQDSCIHDVRRRAGVERGELGAADGPAQLPTTHRRKPCMTLDMREASLVKFQVDKHANSDHLY